MLFHAGVAFIAGCLSVLSPCVLPLLPVVMSSAASAHKWGPAALAAGVASSFVVLSVFVATLGFTIGLDGGFFHAVGALLLVAVGVLLVSPPLYQRAAVAAGPLSNWADQTFSNQPGLGIAGQFGVGLALGAVWGPCVGPTLGAASLLAAQGKDLAQVMLVLLAFGAGALLPLILLGSLSRELLKRWNSRLARTASGGKLVIGAVLIATGALILSGFDKTLESKIVAASPAWLTQLTTRY